MKVYLIANNANLTEKDIPLLNMDNENDIVVLFNYMPIAYDFVKYMKHKIAFLRVLGKDYHQNNKHYLGGVEFIEKQSDFEKVICIDDFGKYDQYVKNIRIPCEKLIVEDIFNESKVVYSNGKYPPPSKCIIYDDPKYPSSGFIGYIYIKSMYPEREIILVGFSGDLWEGHDSKWEKEYYINHKATLKTIIGDDIHYKLKETEYI
jgi:hypothetical protein